MAKRGDHLKMQTLKRVIPSGPAVLVEYPQEGEALGRPCYTFRVGTITEATAVEVSIDQGDWLACREAVGMWWFDWAGYEPGEHVAEARSRLADGVMASSNPRRFTVC